MSKFLDKQLDNVLDLGYIKFLTDHIVELVISIYSYNKKLKPQKFYLILEKCCDDLEDLAYAD